MYISDINRIFSDEVARYLIEGWNINAQTMNSISLGQICKIDLTNGKQILRFELTEENGYIHNDEYYVSWVSFTVSEEVSGGKPNERIIFDKWNAISERRFYEMERHGFNKHGADWFTENFSEIADAITKKKERRDMRRRGYVDDRVFYPITKSILPLVRRFPRCKSVHLEDIESVYSARDRFDKRSYYFVVKGKTHIIEMH